MHPSTGEIEVGELEVRGHSQQAVEPTWTTSDSVSIKTIKESEGPQALHYTGGSHCHFRHASGFVSARPFDHPTAQLIGKRESL